MFVFFCFFFFMDNDALSLLVNQTPLPSSGGVSELDSALMSSRSFSLRHSRPPPLPTHLKCAARISR